MTETPQERIDRVDQPRLIGDELAKLAERLIVQPSSLTTAGLNPFADVGQIFQPNRAPGALRV